MLAIEAVEDGGPVVQAHLSQVLPERQVGGIQGRRTREREGVLYAAEGILHAVVDEGGLLAQVAVLLQ